MMYGSKMGMCWLSRLTSLQQLHVGCASPSAYGDVRPNLQHLTQLHYTSSSGGSALLTNVSSLQRLKELVVLCEISSDAAAGFARLPAPLHCRGLPAAIVLASNRPQPVALCWFGLGPLLGPDPQHHHNKQDGSMAVLVVQEGSMAAGCPVLASGHQFCPCTAEGSCREGPVVQHRTVITVP